MSTALIGAAFAGIAVGVGATLALSPSKSPKPVSASTAPLPSSTSSPTSPSPLPYSSGSGNGGTVVPYQPLGGGMIPFHPNLIGPTSDFLQRAGYMAAYDRRHRIPAWTAEHLTQASLRRPPSSGGSEGGGGDRKNSTFQEDADIPEFFRAKLLDYFRSGYDRGHMVPAADCKSSQKAMDETFMLTNIAPQVGDGFNRHYWAYLEQFVRTLTSEFSDVYVFTVPLFLPKKDGRDGKWRVSYEVLASGEGESPTIAVPTHFAKVVAVSRPLSGSWPTPQPTNNAVVSKSGSNTAPQEWSIGAFVLPNDVIPDETPLESFVVPVEAVESSAGLMLFPPSLKAIAKPLCRSTKCQVVVRRFDDAQKSLGGKGDGKGKKDRRGTI